jgi:DNA modification methylase
MSALPRNQLLLGDAATRLADLPAGSVDCVVTSPPYFGLRDYGTPGQIGLEPDIDAWVNQLVEVARQARRVLTLRGSMWLNVGDSYAHTPVEGAPRKSLLLGPQRLALALVADGWLLRNQVVWAKTNPMPESVTDRLSGTYEIVLFLAVQRNYYFNLDAVRAPITSTRTSDGTQHSYPPREVLPAGRIATAAPNHGLQKIKALGLSGHPLGKNPGDVWRLATAGYRGAHFATFPLGLVIPPILATCPQRVCAICRTPWQRSLERHHGRLLATGPLDPSCVCAADWQPGVVLDPFIGSGTTAITAEAHGRDWIGIEIKPEYASLAQERIQAERDKRAAQEAENQPAVSALNERKEERNHGAAPRTERR